MSLSVLADAKVEVLDFMTVETYLSAVISAYLDALDQGSPVPEDPSAGEAYCKLPAETKGGISWHKRSVRAPNPV